MHRILTFISWLSGLCFQSLHHRFIAWTKPDTTSLLLGTLIDLSKSKSELVAENARYASTTDHPAATGETACLYQDGPHSPGPAGQDSSELETSPRHRSGRRRGSRWHRQGYKLFWRYKSRAMSATPKISAETVALRKRDGKGQSTMGSRTEPWRTPQAGHSCVQTHYSEIHEAGTHHQATRTDVEHVLAFSCPADLGL